MGEVKGVGAVAIDADDPSRVPSSTGGPVRVDEEGAHRSAGDRRAVDMETKDTQLCAEIVEVLNPAEDDRPRAESRDVVAVVERAAREEGGRVPHICRRQQG